MMNGNAPESPESTQTDDITQLVARPEIATIGEFVQARLAHLSSGLSWFSEVELDHDTDIFGRVGHRFTTYRKQGKDSTGTFDVRGRISTQVGVGR